MTTAAPSTPAGPAAVTPERVVEILQRTELGAALWRAAVNEALVEMYQARVEQLERLHAPAPDGEGSDQ